MKDLWDTFYFAIFEYRIDIHTMETSPKTSKSILHENVTSPLIKMVKKTAIVEPSSNVVPLRDVYVRFQIGLLTVDSVNQVCTYLVTLFLKWKSDEQFESTNSEEEWVPLILFSNIMESSMQAKYYWNNQKHCYYIVDYVCKIHNTLRLRRFPYDSHQLYFAFRSNCSLYKWEYNENEILPFPTCSKILEVSICSDDWNLKEIWLDNYNKINNQSICIGYKVFLLVTRKPNYYALNFGLVNLLLGLLSLTSSGVSSDDFAGRSQITLTLILTTIAFKFSVTTYIPPTPYLTVLDMYILTVLIFLSVIILENYIISVYKSYEYMDHVFYKVALAFWIGLHTVLAFGTRSGLFLLRRQIVRNHHIDKTPKYRTDSNGRFGIEQKELVILGDEVE